MHCISGDSRTACISHTNQTQKFLVNKAFKKRYGWYGLSDTKCTGRTHGALRCHVYPVGFVAFSTRSCMALCQVEHARQHEGLHTDHCPTPCTLLFEVACRFLSHNRWCSLLLLRSAVDSLSPAEIRSRYETYMHTNMCYSSLAFKFDKPIQDCQLN